MTSDRFHFIVQNARTGEILSRDLIVEAPKVVRVLSGPAQIEFNVNQLEYSARGIYFKPWGHIIHAEKEVLGERRIWCSAIVQPSQVDKSSGVLSLKAVGFSDYPKGLPWLENWNPITNDAFEPVHRIWNHIQSYPNGNLNVEVYPEESGVEQLPGYAFDGDILNLDFFATFIRAEDKQDCGEYIQGLARDIPFDYREHSAWNDDRSDVLKKIELGYPRVGYDQTELAFVINENIIEAVPHIETEIERVSDIGVAGWFPGKQYSYELTNADPDRLRRYLKEEDSKIDSNERAKARAGRKLARRQTPAYWESILIDMEHPNAPFGYYDVGDRITVQGPMAWVGDVKQVHKIIAISVDETKSVVELALKAEGAFNYDPIIYPSSTYNILSNPNFTLGLEDWTPTDPSWDYDPGQGHDALGAAMCSANGVSTQMVSDKLSVSDNTKVYVEGWTKVSAGLSSTGSEPVQLGVRFFQGTTSVGSEVVGATFANDLVAWKKLARNVIIPNDVDGLSVQLTVTDELTSGVVYFDDIKLTLL